MQQNRERTLTMRNTQLAQQNFGASNSSGLGSYSQHNPYSYPINAEEEGRLPVIQGNSQTNLLS